MLPRATVLEALLRSGEHLSSPDPETFAFGNLSPKVLRPADPTSWLFCCCVAALSITGSLITFEGVPVRVPVVLRRKARTHTSTCRGLPGRCCRGSSGGFLCLRHILQLHSQPPGAKVRPGSKDPVVSSSAHFCYFVLSLTPPQVLSQGFPFTCQVLVPEILSPCIFVLYRRVRNGD